MIIKSLRSDVSTPCWVETGEAGRIGAAEGISGRVIFADFSSRTPGKIYRKNSDSPRLFTPVAGGNAAPGRKAAAPRRQ